MPRFLETSVKQGQERGSESGFNRHIVFSFSFKFLPSTKTKPRKVKVAPTNPMKIGMQQNPISNMKRIDVTDRSFASVRICSSHDCELILSPVDKREKKG